MITPLQVYTALYPIKDPLYNSNKLLRIIAENATPLIIALVNIGIIPTIVDIFAMLITNETKSELQYSILKMNLVFMLLNMVLLPMTGLVSYEEILFFIKDENFTPENIINAMSENLGNMVSFFVVYLMQVTFFSNMIQLYDIPHLLFKQMMRFVYFIQ